MSVFCDRTPEALQHARIAAMAPTKTAPHKSNNHERYLPEDVNKAKFQRDLEGSDTEDRALQTVNGPQDDDDDDFEGFDDEHAAQDGAGQDEESDADSVKFVVEGKPMEKVVLPKDAEEEELERLIFGDSAGFMEGLDNFSAVRATGAYGEASDEEQDADADLDNVADDNLFFFDSGPVAAPAGSVAVAQVEESDDDDEPAWEDSDDERLVVSLASVPQLRKLRETAEDDMVNGKEYARRLRKQYERLYPAPEWAVHATGAANKKRRRTMDDDESGDESASDMDVDEDDLSTQPLARLLKDADIFSRTSTRGPTKKRKLQAGTIDIQRLKDVSKAGPVSILALYVLTHDHLANPHHSLPSLPSHSTHRTRFFFPQDRARRSTFITSIPTPQHRTRFLLRST
jgi:U3 small nucleolar RNA-associated protein 18